MPEALPDARKPFHVITRSPMIVRDVDVLAEAAVRAKVSVSFSIPTLDEEVWRRTEPGMPRHASGSALCGRSSTPGSTRASPSRRSCPASPTGPISSRGRRAAREAGARHLWAGVLHLRPGTREHFLAELARDWPEHLAEYERLYGRRAYLPASETKPVQALVARLRAETRAPAAERPRPLRPAPEPEQLALALS